MSVSGVGALGTSQVWSGASPAMAPQQKMAQLFTKMDTANTGTINQSQFDQAFQNMNPPAKIKAAGADTLFKLMDPNQTGQVSKDSFISTMTDLIGKLNAQTLDQISTASSNKTLASGILGLTTLDKNTPATSANVMLGNNINTKA